MFFQRREEAQSARVPGVALILQALWTTLLVLPRTYDAATGKFGNLYSNLLDYVISAALIFYILTIAAVFVLRHRRPNDERPYRAFGYPVCARALHCWRVGHSDFAVRLPHLDHCAGAGDRADRRAGLLHSETPGRIERPSHTLER